jgi:hypothetical protein
LENWKNAIPKNNHLLTGFAWAQPTNQGHSIKHATQSDSWFCLTQPIWSVTQWQRAQAIKQGKAACTEDITHSTISLSLSPPPSLSSLSLPHSHSHMLSIYLSIYLYVFQSHIVQK